VVLLRGHARERQRLLGVAVVARRVDLMGHVVSDHAVLHAFDVGFVEVFADDLANGFQGLAAVVGQFGEIFLDGGGFALHGRSISRRS
jgi:hypothetical protein